MDAKKAYNRIDTNAVWKVIIISRVNGTLLSARRTFYWKSKACMWVGREKGMKKEN